MALQIETNDNCSSQLKKQSSNHSFIRLFTGSMLIVLVCGCSSGRSSQLSTSVPTQVRDTSSSPPEPYWISLATTKDGSQVDLDENSVQHRNSLVTYRTRLRYSQPQEGVSVAGGLEIADCNSGLYQGVGSVFLDQTGRVIGSSQEKTEIRQVYPGSVQAMLYEAVCNPSTPSSSDTNAQLQRQLIADGNKAALEMSKRAMEVELESMSKMPELLARIAATRWDSPALPDNTNINSSPTPNDYPCDYPYQVDSLGRQCGGRAAIVRPGGRL